MLCLEILQKEKNSLCTLASVTDNFVVSFSAVPLGPFYYRNFKNQKIIGLKSYNGKFDANT